MRKLLFFVFTICFSSFINPSEQTYILTVEVEGIKTENGTVLLALYNSEDTYLSEDDKDAYRLGKQKVNGNSIKIVFKDLPKGKYTFAGYHDENDNNQFDKSFGFPKEGYFFSNNAKVSFGPPNYEDAVFILDKDLHQKIILNFGI